MKAADEIPVISVDRRASLETGPAEKAAQQAKRVAG